MLKIKIDKDKLFDFKLDRGNVLLNGEDFKLDISAIDNRHFHIIKDNKCFVAEVIEIDPTSKCYKIKINGQVIDLQLQDSLDLLIEKMGMAESEGLKINEVKAPMPGLILDIKVREGQEVEMGENLLILEAMKMENVIKSPKKGVISGIKVKQGQSVEKNQILLTF